MHGRNLNSIQIRIVRAPHVKLVQGCIDLAYLWPDTPEVGRDFASSNITARNDMINGFLELGRTWFGTVEVGRDYASGPGGARFRCRSVQKCLCTQVGVSCLRLKVRRLVRP